MAQDIFMGCGSGKLVTWEAGAVLVRVAAAAAAPFFPVACCYSLALVRAVESVGEAVLAEHDAVRPALNPMPPARMLQGLQRTACTLHL